MLYRYVGSRQIAERAGHVVRGTPITSADDVVRWLASRDEPSHAEVTVTFVVSAEGTLLIAGRHSEHVACAGNRPVRAAGELCFALEGDCVKVTRASNQSTGYCPEPESWAEVVAALHAAGLDSPEGFAPRCEFRRCAQCGSLNLVKCSLFECSVCEVELPSAYNVQTPE